MIPGISTRATVTWEESKTRSASLPFPLKVNKRTRNVCVMRTHGAAGCPVLRWRNENERSREGGREKGKKKKKRKRTAAKGKKKEEEWSGRRVRRTEARERKRRGCTTASNAAKLAASGAMVCGTVKYKPEGEGGQEKKRRRKGKSRR